ncbi:MAG: hypothetical protein KC492_04135, partial [Myxococcales bacterium]|nr:hypothetical protein [Myxococcales bacterium]
CAELPSFGALDAAARKQLITSALSLISWSQSRLPVPGQERYAPLLQVQVQLWIREARRLLREVREGYHFVWGDEHPQGDAAANGTAPTPALPMYYCRECGHSGWLTCGADLGMSDRITLDYNTISSGFFEDHRSTRYLHQDANAADEPDTPLVAEYFDPKELRVGPKAPEGVPAENAPRVFKYAKLNKDGTKDLRRCPACAATGSLTFLASRSASLASVAVGHLYTTPLNTDRKLLAFSDSVQDASHRAGFFSGRTYRFSVRSAILAVVPDAKPEGEFATEGVRLSDMAPRMFAFWREHPSAGSERFGAEAAMLAAFLPHDLEYLADYRDYVTALTDRTRRIQEAEARGEDLVLAEVSPHPRLLRDLEQRMRWEVTREFG